MKKYFTERSVGIAKFGNSFLWSELHTFIESPNATKVTRVGILNSFQFKGMETFQAWFQFCMLWCGLIAREKGKVDAGYVLPNTNTSKVMYRYSHMLKLGMVSTGWLV